MGGGVAVGTERAGASHGTRAVWRQVWVLVSTLLSVALTPGDYWGLRIA